MDDGKEIVAIEDGEVNPLAVSGSGFTPRNIDEALRLADYIANSDLAPKDMKGKPGNVLVAIQMGMEVGLKPMQAVQNIAVINGRPCVWGDALLGIVQASGLLEGFSEEFVGDADNFAAICTAKRKGIADVFTFRFSVQDAKRAALWGKQGPWSAYPRRMMQMRARGFCLRNGFADVLKGIISREEADDYANAKPAEVSIRVPQRKSAAPSPSTPPTGEPSIPPAPAEPTAPAQNGKGGGGPIITDPQWKRLFAISKTAQLEIAAVDAHCTQKYGHDSHHLTKPEYDVVCAWAERGGVEEPPAGAEREPGSDG